MTLVAGVDSSTQSCTIVIRDATTGELVRSGAARHPDGTEVDPGAWWDAFRAAADAAGGLADVAAIGVAGQQHGMVALDEHGDVVRPALLWNDTRSAQAATDLIGDLGGPGPWAEAVGTVPVASLTVTKLRWLREHDPGDAARVAAVALPHDWLSWRIAGRVSELDALVTDRSDASGTGYWSPRDGYRCDLVELALGRRVHLPRVLGPAESVTARGSEVLTDGTLVGAGTGDNAGAALGLGMRPGDVAISIGTSGVVSAVSAKPTTDASGQVAGFADATGAYLPLACTLNAGRVLDAFCRILGVDHEQLSKLALATPPGADGLTLVPYLARERTPNRPEATGTLRGLRLATSTPEHFARAESHNSRRVRGMGRDAEATTVVPARIAASAAISGAMWCSAPRAWVPRSATSTASCRTVARGICMPTARRPSTVYSRSSGASGTATSGAGGTFRCARSVASYSSWSSRPARTMTAGAQSSRMASSVACGCPGSTGQKTAPTPADARKHSRSRAEPPPSHTTRSPAATPRACSAAARASTRSASSR